IIFISHLFYILNITYPYSLEFISFIFHISYQYHSSILVIILKQLYTSSISLFNLYCIHFFSKFTHNPKCMYMTTIELLSYNLLFYCMNNLLYLIRSKQNEQDLDLLNSFFFNPVKTTNMNWVSI